MIALVVITLLQLLAALLLCLLLYLCTAHWLAFYDILIPPFNRDHDPEED